MTRGVLFDFSGTLFVIESAREAVLHALGPEFLDFVPALERFGAINGSATPDELPDHLAEVWAGRDLSREAHRAAYSGLAEHAGLTAEQARRLYDRGIDADAWTPYPDTLDTLRELQDVPLALVSNIGWDPRPVLDRHGATPFLDALVLSDEIGVMKPDPAIFATACARLGVEPTDAVMIGDTEYSDGGATAIGCRFVLVSAARDRPRDTLRSALARG